MFDKDILLSNITYLSKKKGIKIGDLENYIGVSKGYISRFGKKNGISIGIDIVVSIAQKLEVSLDVLLFSDLKEMDENDQYNLALINKLIRSTEDKSIFGEKIEPYKIRRIMDRKYNSSLPMFVERGNKTIYESCFLERELYQEFEQYEAKPWYKWKMDKRNTMYLIYMLYKTYDNEVQEVYEMYLQSSGFREEDDGYEIDEYGERDWLRSVKYTPLCCSLTSVNEIRNAMASLYRTAEKYKNEVKLSDSIKNDLDRFINS